MGRVVQRDYGISIHGDTQNPIRSRPGQPALDDAISRA